MKELQSREERVTDQLPRGSEPSKVWPARLGLVGRAGPGGKPER